MTTKKNNFDVVIIGGGLVGLSIASHLKDLDGKLCVITGTQGGIASNAAAGMLTPSCEWDERMPDQFLDLLIKGKQYYVEFLNSLNAQNTNYHDSDFLILDLNESKNNLKERFQKLKKKNMRVEWLSPSQVLENEKNINIDILQGAIKVQGEAVIDPRNLHETLKNNVLDHPNQMLLIEDLIAVNKMSNNSYSLNLKNGQTLHCEKIIIASGSWSLEIMKKFNIDVSITPTKGQIIQFSGEKDLLKNVLYLPVGACGCLLERAPGIYIAGTSEEYTNPKVTNTSKVIAAILARVNEVFPPARDFVIEDMWSGFRPTTPDELPIIDSVDNGKVIIVTGHHRNGILLSPLSGKIVKDMILNNESDIDLSPYSLSRSLKIHYRFGAKY